MLKLYEGEVICPQCNGTGEPNNNRVQTWEIKYLYPSIKCDKCGGEGKLDWIEVIVGKKNINYCEKIRLNTMYGSMVKRNQSLILSANIS